VQQRENALIKYNTHIDIAAVTKAKYIQCHPFYTRKTGLAKSNNSMVSKAERSDSVTIEHQRLPCIGYKHATTIPKHGNNVQEISTEQDYSSLVYTQGSVEYWKTERKISSFTHQ